MDENTNIINYDEDGVVEENGRDLSTIIGVGLIAGGGVVVYEGGKRIFKFAKDKVAPKVVGLFKKDHGGEDENVSEDVKSEK